MISLLGKKRKTKMKKLLKMELFKTTYLWTIIKTLIKSLRNYLNEIKIIPYKELCLFPLRLHPHLPQQLQYI